MLHILEYRALKCTYESQTCNIFYLTCILSRRVLTRESIVPPFSPGEDTIFTIIVDNVQYPLVERTYPERARFFYFFFKGLLKKRGGR